MIIFIYYLVVNIAGFENVVFMPLLFLCYENSTILNVVHVRIPISRYHSMTYSYSKNDKCNYFTVEFRATPIVVQFRLEIASWV